MLQITSTNHTSTQQLCLDIFPKEMPSKEDSLINNKVAIITGTSQGIGKITALLLAEKGWSIWATTRNKMKCDLSHKNIHLLEVKLDCEKSIESAVQYVLQKEGHIDALINNAGQMLIGTCEETSIEKINHLFEINVLAPIRLAQAVLPSMRAQNYGRIINLSSAAAIQSVPGLGAFSASKAFLYSFFQALSGELLFWNIKITSLEVGSVKTPWIDNCLLPSMSDVKQYNSLCQSLIERLKQKNQTADDPACVADEIDALLQCESPQLRKPVGENMECFMAQQLVDVRGELYLQKQRSFWLRV